MTTDAGTATPDRAATDRAATDRAATDRAATDRAPTQPVRSRFGLTRGRIGVGLVLTVLAVNAVAVRPQRTTPIHLGAVDGAAAVLGLALLLGHRRYPRSALAGALAATLVTVAIVGRATPMLPVVVLLLFRLASRLDRRQAIAAGLATTVVVAASFIAFTDIGVTDGEILASVGWPAAAVALGDAIRSRRAYVVAVEERARRAEESREEEARRRVAEERLRIAGDLHDLVAHHIAVVNVQAGLAAHLLRTDPDRSEEALGVVRSSARSVLDELGQMLSVLRQADETEAPTGPTPGLDDVAALVATFADAGLEVDWETSGNRRPVNDVTQLAVYRTLQEGLTNAHKHGAGTARAALRFGPEELEVIVENPMATTAPQDQVSEHRGGGFGLIGMQERVTAAGGTLQAGAQAGRFRVQARFPLGSDRTGEETP